MMIMISVRFWFFSLKPESVFLFIRKQSYGFKETIAISKQLYFHGFQCGWNLIKPKHLSSGPMCHAHVFAGFSGHGNSIYDLIPLQIKKKENVHLFSRPWDYDWVVFLRLDVSICKISIMISWVESFLCQEKQGTPEKGGRIQRPEHCVSTTHSKDEDNIKKKKNSPP